MEAPIGYAGNVYPHFIGQINHMAKPISVVQRNKLCLWWKALLSHIGKDVDTERGEELGIIQRTKYPQLLMYYHISSSKKPHGDGPIIIPAYG